MPLPASATSADSRHGQHMNGEKEVKITHRTAWISWGLASTRNSRLRIDLNTKRRNRQQRSYGTRCSSRTEQLRNQTLGNCPQVHSLFQQNDEMMLLKDLKTSPRPRGHTIPCTVQQRKWQAEHYEVAIHRARASLYCDQHTLITDSIRAKKKKRTQTKVKKHGRTVLPSKV